MPLFKFNKIQKRRISVFFVSFCMACGLWFLYALSKPMEYASKLYIQWMDIPDDLKENIAELPSQWGSIKALRPVEFDYIKSEGGGHQIGFIAQEFEEVYPDAVGERADGMKTLTGWSKTDARLTKALQEAMARIEQLEAKVAALESK
jgi:hypothetical protein